MLERLVDTYAPARAHSARVLARIAQDEVSPLSLPLRPLAKSTIGAYHVVEGNNQIDGETAV